MTSDTDLEYLEKDCLSARGYLCDFVLGNGFKFGWGKSEATVCASIMRKQSQANVFFPVVSITQIKTVYPDKPVRARDNPHDKRQL